jgi:hypothetical protein
MRGEEGGKRGRTILESRRLYGCLQKTANKRLIDVGDVGTVSWLEFRAKRPCGADNVAFGLAASEITYSMHIAGHLCEL